MDTEPQERAKYQVETKDARGVVIGDDNRIYQYIVTHDRYRFLAERLYTFTTLIEEKTRGFVGRQFVFEALDDFLAKHDRGYFVVQGEPGIGKTALVAQLVKTRGYVHHFNNASQGIIKPDQFLENIYVQLIAYYQLDRSYSALEVRYDGGYLAGLLEEVSAKLSEGQRAVILVDALDEAERAFDPRANVLYLPPHLPKGVYFVVTHRPVADFPLQVEAPEQIFYLEADSEGNLLDVQFYLEQAAEREGIQAQLQAEGISVEDFVQVLLDKGEGNFMYLRYVVLDIDAGKYPGLKLEELPQGLMDYYESHWRQMRTMDEEMWIAYRQPVICFLAAVQEPVSVEQLAAFSRLPVPRVKAALRDWREFLDEEQIGDQKRWRIYHATFQDFLREKDEVGEVDLTKIHSNIADVVLEQWRRTK